MTRSRYGRSSYDDRYGDERGRDSYGDPRRGGGRPRGPGSGGGGAPGGGGVFQFNMGTVAVLGGVLVVGIGIGTGISSNCLLYTSPSPRDKRQSRMPSSA